MTALVLLHGFTGAPSSWDAVLTAGSFADVHRPSLAGHHPMLPPPLSFDAEVDRLAASIPRGAHLAGYSLGARLALGVAARHPGLLSRLTLLSMRPPLPDDARATRLAADERWAQLLRDGGIDAFCDAWEAQPLFANGLAKATDAARAATRARRRAHDPSALAATLVTLSPGNMPAYAWPRLPLRLLVGADDVALCRASLGLRVEVIRGGHDLLLESPSAVADCLTNPLSREVFRVQAH